MTVQPVDQPQMEPIREANNWIRYCADSIPDLLELRCFKQQTKNKLTQAWMLDFKSGEIGAI